MWRSALTLSLLAHVVLGTAFWLLADRVHSGMQTPMSLDTRVHEEEISIMVSAIGSPLPRRPGDQETRRPGDQETRTGPGDQETRRPGDEETRTGNKETTDWSPGLLVSWSPGLEATTVFFQVATPARSVVYVIDRSGSMGSGGRLALARQELLASLERLPPSARFQVVPYNRHAAPLRIDGRTELVPATRANKEAAARLLEAVVPEGGTDHRPALQTALRLEPEAIYFLTDADDLPAELVRALTQQNRGRTAIHAIELTTAHRDRLDMPLHLLARQNGGNYQCVDVK